MKLSEHFTLEELCFSAAAARLGMDNQPDATAMVNLRRVAAAMEQVRERLGDLPVLVHSGYRSAAVNRLVGGVATSAHCRGLACDFVCPAFGTPQEVALAVEQSGLAYDQLILEYGWVHVGLAPEGVAGRLEALTKRSAADPYEAGILG
jgi:hypothetical protein